jgi:hypothetical protein
MKISQWLKITLLLTASFTCIVVIINIFIDTYGVYLSLFSINKELKLNSLNRIAELNQQIFNTEYILRHRDKFDSFLFGSSRVGLIDTSKITGGNFYNMSYPLGAPAEHLAIIKTFLQKDVKIKTIIIGLDEFSFSVNTKLHQTKLFTIMHPAVSGKNLLIIFYKYFLRIPKLLELANGIKILQFGKFEDKLTISEHGLNLGWMNKEKVLVATGIPFFSNETITYAPYDYDEKAVDQALSELQEIIFLAKEYNFKLIFFINPIYSKLYLNSAAGLFPIKEKLALMTDYYDFSGMSFITNNSYYSYDGDHYRYIVGDMIIKKIFDSGKINVPQDFGVFVTSRNVSKHIKQQKRDLEKYLAESKIKQ